MPRLLLLSFFLIFTSFAWAQPQQESTASTRLAASLGQCIGLLEGRNDQVLELQKKLDQAQAELEELKKGKKDAK